MNMKFLLSLLLSSVALAAPTVTSVVAREVVAPVEVEARDIEPRAVTKIRFDQVTGGSGCPGLSATYSSARDLVTIGFQNYKATIPGTTSRDCTVTVRMTYPSGCTSGNFRLGYHGYVQVDSGVTARLTTNYAMTTGNNHSPPASAFSGPAWVGGGNYNKADVSPAKLVNRSAGDATVNLTIRVRLNMSRTNSNAGEISADDVTLDVINQSRNTNWQTCTV